MRTIWLATAAAAAFAASAASAQPIRTRVYPPPPGLLEPDEVRDYQLDQLDRRQEMQREALRFHQKVERRIVDPDDDGDED